MNNTGVTGRILQYCVFDPRDSAYAVNLTYDDTHIYIHIQGCPQKKKEVEWCFYNIFKINKTTRWEVVKNSASPKRPFFFFLDFVSFFPFLYLPSPNHD